MSIVDYDKIDGLSKKTNGMINSEIIDYAKEFLASQIMLYIPDLEKYEFIKRRIFDIDVKMVNNAEFMGYYKANGGKGMIPGAFYHNGSVYFRNDLEFNGDDFHKLIHEMFHAISDNRNGKHGLIHIDFEKKYFYGYGFNEACTEYLASIITNEPFSNYAKDLYLILQIFMNLTNIDFLDIMDIYLNQIDWVESDIQTRFSDDKSLLPELVVLYDQRLLQIRKKNFEPNRVLKIIFDVIKEKIIINSNLDYVQLDLLLRDYYNYCQDVWSLSSEIKNEMAEIMDIIGSRRSLM